MIETEQTVQVNVDIDSVWNYARDMQRWASIMPGYQECEIINDDDSRWILKIGVGGLVRTVKVLVHVDNWDGPENVDFTYKLEGDPVEGSGTYRASKKGDNETEVTLQVQVCGSGPMAPMWEAMGAPVLPQFAKGFAEQLKAKIEETAGAPASQPAAAAQTAGMSRSPSIFAQIAKWLRNFWQALFNPQT